jgi:DeoR family fructose operon transcriptional repressor
MQFIFYADRIFANFWKICQYFSCRIFHYLSYFWQMTAEERQHRIEEYVQQVEFVTLEELARHADVSLSTVRRDLNLLESAGKVRRTHGGARLVNPKSDEFAFTARDTHQIDEKELIGITCAGLIDPGQTVIIDAGTTAYHVAKELQEKNLQVVTHSLPVANLFMLAQMTEVVVTGGVIYPRLGVLVGPMAVKAYSEIHADVAVMGAGGITLDGITNSHALLIDIQRAIMKSAGRVVFCLDHTKFGRKSVAFLCSLESAPTIVTDKAAPGEMVEALRQRGLEVFTATESGFVGGSEPGGVGSVEARNRVAVPAEGASVSEKPTELEPEMAASAMGWD